ncbi:hypothetical protein BC941DRAFT_44071 [Chlamydoabsidia padenii]|nr:hypothetical protein BC941DRAFT_44071 [Chlamydoabsidia padenii]
MPLIASTHQESTMQSNIMPPKDKKYDMKLDPEAINACAMATGVWPVGYEGQSEDAPPKDNAQESLFDYLRGLSWLFSKTTNNTTYPSAGSPESMASTDNGHSTRTSEGKYRTTKHSLLLYILNVDLFIRFWPRRSVKEDYILTTLDDLLLHSLDLL